MYGLGILPTPESAGIYGQCSWAGHLPLSIGEQREPALSQLFDEGPLLRLTVHAIALAGAPEAAKGWGCLRIEEVFAAPRILGGISTRSDSSAASGVRASSSSLSSVSTACGDVSAAGGRLGHCHRLRAHRTLEMNEPTPGLGYNPNPAT